MDTEKSSEVLDAASETPQQQETGMEKVVVSKLETPEETTEPEKPPATVEDTEQMAVNGHDADQSLMNVKETEELMVTEIVTESVKLSEGTPEIETKDSLPEEMSEQEKSIEKGQESEDTETLPGAVAKQPEPDGSPERISDPVTALNTEPENIQLEQQPVPENIPEPLPLHKPLAESAPEPEPEKLVESVPEVELPEPTLPEPVMLQQPVDVQLPSHTEKAPEQVETEAELQTAMDTEAEVVKDVVAEPTKEVEAEKPAETAEVEMERAAETELVTEAAAEKPTEAVMVTLEKPAEIENTKPAEDVKEVEPEKPVEADTEKAVEPAAEGEADKSEQKDTEEEGKVPAPGSLSFALLEQEQTKVVLQTSRTLIVLKGLPGSGKTLLARAIADAYKDHCSVFSADDHGVKPENPEVSADGYKALDEAVVAHCSAGTAASVLVVVDDTNHTQDRLARLGEIAEQHHLVAIFLEPRTEWRRDLSQLAKRTGRGLEEAQIQAMKGPLEEMILPLFFGWFLLPTIQEKVRCTSMDFLKTLDTLEPFKKHMNDFTGEAEKEVDLEQYFQAKGPLHCTTKFCDYGKAEGAEEYAEKQAVKELYGSAFELSLSALFVTPRTVGARVSLSEEQLVLWPADAEKEAESAVPAAASLPLGSRAHVTLGCAEGVDPVQTGLDLLEILALQQEGQQGELVEEMELGSLAYYGKGRWLLSLREPICVQSCFSSVYGPKKPDQTKKEVEKKKKPKCTIL
ncbi:2',3'-cyclic-nucleotide 3'-phosphodiesterase [Centroberyx affinis]|uniref:2',3'-cyclic-nucleotide 3'-phosphodiesterase n=1 Tax=Centroberyx affinis TaxID=166261 RepID=UPI003A5BE6A9